MEDNQSSLTSAFLGDNAVLNAVASLLSKQQSTSKEEIMSPNTSLLVLGNTHGKDTVEGNVVGSSHGINHTRSNSSDAFVQSLEQVHALATANLLASTQRDIAQQLVEASLSKSGPETNRRQQNRLNQSKRKDSKCSKAVDDIRKSNSILEAELISSEPKALNCSFEGCNRKFAWLTHLKYHEMTHTNNRQFECPDENCGKTFFTAQRLKVHLMTHTGEKPFRCTYSDCCKTFATAGNLKNHERIHTGEQPFLCDFSGCNRRFTEYSSLRKHKLTHSGDKPFECKVCNKKFTQSGSRRQHLIRHHLDEEIRNSLKNNGYSKDDSNKEEGKNDSAKLIDIKHSDMNECKTPITSVSCSPQVMVLSNAYHSHPTSESIVFSQSLNEHIVRVTNASHHHLTDTNSISLSHTLLNPHGLHDEPLVGKSDELVALSQAPIFRREDHTRDIVYATDILDHEEVTHADYHVSAQVDACEEIVAPVEYHHQGDSSVQTDVSLHHCSDPHQSDIYQSHEDYIQHEDLQDPSGAYAHVKGEISSPYLTTDGEVLHEDFIGTKEVTISTSSGLVEVSEEDLAAGPSFMPVKESVASLMDWDEHLHKH